MDSETRKKYGGRPSEVMTFIPGAPTIVSVLEAGHFLYGKVNTIRYQFEPEDPDSPDALYESIHKNGVEQIGSVWWHNDIGHIISGTRRWIRLTHSNNVLADEGLPPRGMRFEVKSTWSETVAIQKFNRANLHHLPNDALTRLEGAVIEEDSGVDPETVAENWGLTVWQLANAAALINASLDLKEAVASGRMKLQAALKLAKAHPAHEAQIATLNAPKAAKAKRKYMSDDKRTKLRDMLLAYQAGQPPNPMDLGEYIALL